MKCDKNKKNYFINLKVFVDIITTVGQIKIDLQEMEKAKMVVSLIIIY